MVYSSVIFVLAWSAILLVSTLLPPTSCRQIIFARRRECGPKSGKSQPSASAALFRASRTPSLRTVQPGQQIRKSSNSRGYYLTVLDTPKGGVVSDRNCGSSAVGSRQERGGS